MNYKISICISCHNTGHLLGRCIDSILNQTYNNLEIVIVDNGSTDDSYEIMKKYRDQYPKQIKVIQQVDLGLAQGRNTGVTNSLGDLITFLDADDYIESNTYEIVVDKFIETNADIVEFESIKDGILISSQYTSNVKSEIYLRNYFRYGIDPTMLWLRVYKRDLFNKNVFPKIYTNNEDNFAFPCLINSSNSIAFIKKPLHHYMTDNDNAYMKKINNLKYSNEKIKLSRINALSSVIFVKDFLFKYSPKYYVKEFDYYVARALSNFVFFKYESYMISDRLHDASRILRIDKKELRRLLKFINRFGLIIYVSSFIIGLNNTVKLYIWIKNTILRERKK